MTSRGNKDTQQFLAADEVSEVDILLKEGHQRDDIDTECTQRDEESDLGIVLQLE